ncbi:MAG: hypothetical protein KF875_03795 [Trueperaceae bacterium]|nr:hypothetical protein [Trueperaceae bacterium]
MSVNNFVPQVWSARTKAHLDANLVIAARANRDWEADARSGTVKINEVGDVPVVTHSKGATVAYSDPASTQQTLSLNQRKIAGFKVDDLDAIQANINLVERYSRRMGVSLANDIDRAIAGTYTAAGAGNIALTLSSLTAGDVRKAFADAAAMLDTNNVPADDRWALLSPLFQAAMFKDTAITQATDRGDAVLASGAIGRFMGFDLYQSNNLLGTGVTVTTTADEPVGETSIAVSALSAAVPAGTLLTFGPGRQARLTANANSGATTITVAPITVALPSGSVATYVKVRKAMFGSPLAITFAQNLFPTVEALRDVDTTDDYVRAQQNYGYLVVEPYALGTFTVTEAA